MDERLFVRIEVPTLPDGIGDGGGSFGICGTGYPVGEHLILPVRHVVAPAHRGRRHPIRVHWVSFPDFGAQGRVALDPDDDRAIVYLGGGDPDDIALLCCPQRPPGVTTPPWPWGGAPQHDAGYSSIGYPQATRFDDPGAPAQGPTQNRFGGNIRIVAHPWFEITDPHAPSAAEHWQGASGMPIFVEGRIVGVFSAALGLVPGKGHALPIAPLFADPAFAGWFLDQRVRQDWQRDRAAALADVQRHLARSALLMQRVRERLLPVAGCTEALLTRDANADPAQAPAAIAHCLFGLGSIEAFAALLGEVHADLQGDRAAAGSADAAARAALDALLALLLRAAPMLYDPHLAQSVRLNAPPGELLLLPAALYSVAELMVAAAEQRAAQYQRRRGTADEDPRGLAALTAWVPELGIAAGPQDYCERMQVHLGHKEFTGTGTEGERFDRDRMLMDFDRFLLHFYPRGRPTDGSPEDRRRGIDRRLHRFPDPQQPHQRYRLYTVFRPRDAEELQEMRLTAHELHRRYPNLRVVLLTAYCTAPADPPGPWNREADRLYEFHMILPWRDPATGVSDV